MALEVLGVPMEQEKAIAGASLVGSLWWYAAAVLYPSLPLKAIGLYRPPGIGELPPLPTAAGLGPCYSRRHPFPLLMESLPESYGLVSEFDRIAGEYERFVQPFSAPLMAEALKVMRPYLTPSSRLIDTSCGAGTEALGLATLVPDGEVVAADLAAEMVQATFEQARRAGVGNMAFFQADAAHLPEGFSGAFDATFASLAFHHYPEPGAVVREIHRVLRPGGYAFVVDAGPEWFKLMSNWLASWADPGWMGFHSGEEFEALFKEGRFSRFHWEELLPGLGLVVAMK